MGLEGGGESSLSPTHSCRLVVVETDAISLLRQERIIRLTFSFTRAKVLLE